MKKFVAILAVLVMMASMMACAAPSSVPAAETQPAPAAEAQTAPAEEAKNETAAATEEAAAPEEEAPASKDLPISEIGKTSDPYATFDIRPNGDYEVFYANFADTNNFSVYVQSGIQAACEYYGVNLTRVDNNLDPVQAINNGNTAITMGVDFYINYNQSIEANARLGGMLDQANIPCCTIQVKMAKGEGSDQFEPFFGISNEDCGFVSGEAGVKGAVEKWGADAPIIFYTCGKAGQQMHQYRIDGAIKGAQSVLPDVECVTVFTPNNQATEYSQNVTDFLTAHPDSKVVFWSPNDMTGLAMVQAIKLAGRVDDCLYVSAQYDPSMAPELTAEDSCVYACTDVFPESWGWIIVPQIIKLLNDGTPLPDAGQSINVLLTKDNYSEYYDA